MHAIGLSLALIGATRLLALAYARVWEQTFFSWAPREDAAPPKVLADLGRAALADLGRAAAAWIQLEADCQRATRAIDR